MLSRKNQVGRCLLALLQVPLENFPWLPLLQLHLESLRQNRCILSVFVEVNVISRGRCFLAGCELEVDDESHERRI